MVVLRTLFRPLASGILRLIVLAGILLAAYLVVIEPALESTGKAVRSADRRIERQVLDGAQAAARWPK